MKKRFWIGAGVLAGVGLSAGIGLIVAGLLFSPSATAGPVPVTQAPASTTPKAATTSPVIAWTPTSVVQSITPGQTKGIPVAFMASMNLSNVVVRVVPELQSLVQVTPSSIASIQKGQTITLTLTIAAPITALPASLQGTIRLLVSSTTIAQPLPVSVNVVWAQFTDPTSGISFSYTTFGATGTALVSDQAMFGAAATSLIDAVDVQFPGTNGGTRTQYRVVISKNSPVSSPADWFREHVDPASVLLGNGTFVDQVLPNGMTAFTYTGKVPLPDDYDPVSSFYAVSASGATVVVIGSVEDNSLAQMGVNYETLLQTFLSIASSIQVP